MVQDLIGVAVGGAIGALVVNEIVDAIEYTGPGEDLLGLMAFFVIAVAIMAMVEESDM